MKSPRLSLSAMLVATSALIAPVALAQQTDAAAGTQDTQTAQAGDEQRDLIVVRGLFIPEPLQDTSEVAAFLTIEDLERQGDGDAAAALARVTGLSVVNSKFVYVRGLGERYSSALLNGSPLPSPEPLQRVVPLDLFPTSVLSGMMVQKSYSAEFPGEFGGGVVELSTLNIPQNDFLELGVGFSVNTATTLATGYTYDGGSTDWLGFDDGLRKIPLQLREVWDAGVRVNSGLDLYPSLSSEQERQRIGQSFENAKLRLLQLNTEIPASGAFDISGGKVWDIGDIRIGTIGVLGYANDWETQDGIRQSAGIAGDAIVPADDYNYTQTSNNVSWDGLIGAGVEFGPHSVNLTNLWVRRSSKIGGQQFGTNSGQGEEILTERTGWYERELFNTQLAGEFDFGNFGINWRAAYGATSREAPYEWEIQYGWRPDLQRYVHDGGRYSNLTRFASLEDDVLSGGVDFRYSIPMANVRAIDIYAGASYQDNNRYAESREYRFFGNQLSLAQQQQRVDFLLSDFNQGPNAGQFLIGEVTGNVENAPAYDAQLESTGVYAKIDFEPIQYFRASLGARWEDATETVQLIDLYGADPAPRAIEKDYVLPAGTLTWNFMEDMQFRIGASRTIGRPQFRELAPQTYYDPESNRLLTGNPFLQDTKFKNIDARYEYFFAPGQYFTVGAFYKDIERPVEAIATPAGGIIAQSYINVPAAEVMGTEIEIKKIWDDPFPNAFFLGGKSLLVQANYTYSTAEVSVSPGDIVFVATPGSTLPTAQAASNYVIDGERLQGQSDHVANLQFGYEDEASKSQATFILTYVSERVSGRAPGTVAGAPTPDITEEPSMMLDFTYRKELGSVFGRPVNFSFKAKNLLDEDMQEVQTFNSAGTFQGGEVMINGYQRGQTYSFGLSTSF